MKRSLGVVFKGLIVPAARPLPGVGARSTALQRVANRPIVCHVLEAMRRAGVAEVALLVSGAESAELRDCVRVDGPAELDVEYVLYRDGAFEPALAAAAALVGEAACVVHAANGLLTQPLAPLLGLPRVDAPDLVALVHQQPAGSGSIGLAARRLLRLADTPYEDRGLDLAGVCLLGPGALRHAIGVRAWQGGELDLVTVAERLADEGGRLGIEYVSGWRSNTGEVVDLLECNRIALDALSREPAGAGTDSPGTGAASRGLAGTGPVGTGPVGTGPVGTGPVGTGLADTGAVGNRIEGYVEMHPTACIQSSVIVGPATLGPGAQVLDSYIGPYTSIGADVRIEGAEVERSIILPGASIVHIGGRLVGSVVGRDARIFRDFSLPRALRMNVGDGGEVALC